MATTIKQWVEGHGIGPTARVAKRIERFAGNSTDSAVQAAAQELVEIITEAQRGKANADTIAE